MSYSITKPPVLVEAWGQQSTVTTDYIVPPQSGSSTVQTQDNGWTPIYQEDLPPDGSGLPITRQQMNGVLNLYSSHDFWLQAGGTYTFEQDISDACGGYPAGQVLWSAYSQTWQLSLVNNNTANFVTDHTKINDGTNWKQINPSIRQISYVTAGSYSFVVPAGVRVIYITAAAAGGGGGSGNTGAGGGGSGGANVVNGAYSVTPGATLSINIGGGGSGGTGASDGADGVDLTITGGITLTLAGGPGGKAGGLGVVAGGTSGDGNDGGAGINISSGAALIAGSGGGTVFCSGTPGGVSIAPNSANGAGGYMGCGGSGGAGPSGNGANGADGALIIVY